MWGRTAATIRVESLVVLPFADLTPGPESEYLADGVTDAVITELGQLGPLRVTSRTSSMRYRDSKTSPWRRSPVSWVSTASSKGRCFEMEGGSA